MTNRLPGASNQRSIQNTTPNLSSAPANHAVNGPAQQQASQGDAPSTNPGSESQTPAQSPASTISTSSQRPLPAQLRSQMVNIPPDVWDKIASYDLSHADITRMSALGNGSRSAFKPRLKSKRYAYQAQRFNSLTEMQHGLQKIKSLRADLKSEPLRQVMLRLHALPLRDRAAGLVSFRAALADPALAIEHRPSVPPALDRILSHPDAGSAVSAGERVDATASIFNLTEHDDILRLEMIATDTVALGAAMLAGGTVQTVARQFGITTLEGMRHLEILTIGLVEPGTAGAAIRAGRNAQAVARQFGITTQEGVSDLERVSIGWGEPGTAGAAMRARGTVQIVARQFGITTQEGVRELERWTIETDAPGTAGAAIRAGRKVQTVARQFGITTPEGVRHLEVLSTPLIVRRLPELPPSLVALRGPNPNHHPSDFITQRFEI